MSVWAGSFGKAFVVLNYGGEKVGLVVEMRSMTMTHTVADMTEIQLEGWVVQRVSPDDRPDIGGPKQLEQPRKQLTARGTAPPFCVGNPEQVAHCTSTGSCPRDPVCGN
jgi:hypothetical protein